MLLRKKFKNKMKIKKILIKPIVCLLVVIFLKQILWLGIVPLWQFPDEQAHFAQVQNNHFLKKSQ